MRCVFAFIGVLLGASASAQSTIGMGGGYVYADPGFENIRVSTGRSLNGWLANAGIPITDNVGIIARADGAYGETFHPGIVIRPQANEVRTSVYTFTAGPFASVTRSQLTLFVDGLVGIAHGKARNMGVDFLAEADSTRFVGGVGGGVTLRVSQLVDFQVDVQYRRTNLFDQTLQIVQVGAGVMLKPRRR
jgi:hypothetical protein